MSKQPEPFVLGEQLRTTMLIHGAMIAGATMVAVIMIFTIGLPPMPELSKMDIGFFGIIAAVVAIGLSATALSRPFKFGPSPGSATKPEERAFGEWQSSGLVRAAVLEGTALMNIVFAVFAAGGLANLVPALLCMGAMAMFFPTKDDWERYRESRVPELEA